MEKDMGNDMDIGIWGFPKSRGTFLGGPYKRIIVLGVPRRMIVLGDHRRSVLGFPMHENHNTWTIYGFKLGT